jgi:hypothetical protein
VLGTIMSNVYQHSIAPSLADLPNGARETAAGSAEATRRTAVALGRPELVHAANDAFIHSMHIAAVTAAGCALVGAIVIILAFRARRSTAVDEAATLEPAGIDG